MVSTAREKSDIPSLWIDTQPRELVVQNAPWVLVLRSSDSSQKRKRSVLLAFLDNFSRVEMLLEIACDENQFCSLLKL